MAQSNKPLLWLPFAGGGLVAALIIRPGMQRIACA
jgi:fumarate reductase subunit D